MITSVRRRCAAYTDLLPWRKLGIDLQDAHFERACMAVEAHRGDEIVFRGGDVTEFDALSVKRDGVRIVRVVGLGLHSQSLARLQLVEGERSVPVLESSDEVGGEVVRRLVHGGSIGTG